MRKDDIAKLAPGTAMFCKTGKHGIAWDVILVDPQPVKHLGVWLVKVRLLEKPDPEPWRKPELWGVRDDGTPDFISRRSWGAGEEFYVQTRVVFDHEGEASRVEVAAEERRKAREAEEKRNAEVAANRAASEQRLRNQLLVGEKIRYSSRQTIKIESTEPDIVERLMLVGVRRVCVEVELNVDGNLEDAE